MRFPCQERIKKGHRQLFFYFMSKSISFDNKTPRTSSGIMVMGVSVSGR